MLLGSSSGFRLPATQADIASGQVFDDGRNGTGSALVTSEASSSVFDFLPGGGGVFDPFPPFPDFGDLPGVLGGVLGGFVGGGSGGFLPAPDIDCGPSLVYNPITGQCDLQVQATGGTTMPGRVVYDNCGRCFIERFLPARTVRRKGRMSCLPNGQQVCVPARRRMNALNPRALGRALRRAKAFAKFARKAVKIQTTFKKGGTRFGRTPRKKKTCST